MPRLLTKRKQRWANKRKPETIQGLPLQPNAAVEMRYRKKLHALIDRMTQDVEKELRRFFSAPLAEEYFALDESIASQARILMNRLMQKYNDVFAQAAAPMAESMLAASDKASSAALHSSLQQLTGGLSLPTSAISKPMREAIKASVSENVQLIKSIPQQYLTGVQGAVMRSIVGGKGDKNLFEFLGRHKGITQRRANMIANDQTRKAFNNLSRARMERVGLKKFKWLHTGGSNEPRQLHIRMNGNVYSFDDLPIIDERTGERGIPGQAINCRCRMQPVLEFEEESEADG